jgi:large subunit ribosomal protein L5
MAVQMKERLRDLYREQIVPTMMREFGYKNPLQVPRLEKIVINVGLGEAIQNARAIEAATRDIAAITGQRPGVTRARTSIAAF